MENTQQNLLNNLKNTDSLPIIQKYIKEVINLRGFENQDIKETLLLLTEEVGELAKSIRKDATNMSVDNEKLNHYDKVELEIADVFIVLTSICNSLNIDLYDALIQKEKININRKWTK